MTARAAAATTSEADRHPDRSLIQASTGRKTSCPVALAAVRTPMTSSRRRTNQRLATMAANTRAIDPVPSPIKHPQSRTSCQLPVTLTLRPLPAAISPRATLVTARTPKRSMRAPRTGGDPEQDQVDPDGQRDHARGPAELLLQGHHEHPGGGAEPGRALKGHKGHRGGDPRRVQPGPSGGGDHGRTWWIGLSGACRSRGRARRPTDPPHSLTCSFLRHCGLSCGEWRPRRYEPCGPNLGCAV
jgi:hypothetical protein